MKRKNMTVLFTMILLAVVGACSETADPIGGTGIEDGSEEFEVMVVERPDNYIEEEIETHIEYPFFSHVILEKGYRVFYREAAHFKAKDVDTGELVDMTAIPCRLPDNDESIAMIYYMKSDEGYIVSAAEFYKDEDYDIPHILDEAAYTLMSELNDLGLLRMPAKDNDEISTRFWKCVVKRFGAGCLGCALKCYISGPAWGACATACCAGTVVVAMVSCAFTVYGW